MRRITVRKDSRRGGGTDMPCDVSGSGMSTCSGGTGKMKAVNAGAVTCGAGRGTAIMACASASAMSTGRSRQGSPCC